MRSRYLTTDIPKMKFRRNLFKCPHSIKMTASPGKLYPLGQPIEVVPGDTIGENASFVCRINSSLLSVPFDQLALQVYAFFVPWRLCYDNLERVFADPGPSDWSAPYYFDFPVTESVQKCYPGSVGDYLGLPVYHAADPDIDIGLGQQIPIGLNMMPFRAFALIWNEWFRNENVQQETVVNKSTWTAGSETLDLSTWNEGHYTGQLPPVMKTKDIFTAAFKNTQKGAPSSVSVNSNVLAGTSLHYMDHYISVGPTASVGSDNANPLYVGKTGNLGFNSLDTPILESNVIKFDSSNLVAEGSFLVNDLRLAVQLQKMRERDALGGRYREYLYLNYGVSNGDARMQIPEFLGGASIPLQVQQTSQTAPSDSTQVGSVAGYSFTGAGNVLKYKKSFTEHGYIMYVGCLKLVGGHTYQQGISRLWSRKNRNDVFNPILQNLSYQSIFESEIFAPASPGVKPIRDLTSVFGYGEPFYEYRMLPNQVLGQMRTESGSGLDIWHFADYYSSAPALTSAFTNESSENVSRAVALDPDAGYDMFLIDGFFDTKIYRAISLYGDPGRMDHNF